MRQSVTRGHRLFGKLLQNRRAQLRDAACAERQDQGLLAAPWWRPFSTALAKDAAQSTSRFPALAIRIGERLGK